MIKVSAASPSLMTRIIPTRRTRCACILSQLTTTSSSSFENKISTVAPSINAADVKRFKQLDSQAKNIICGHLSKGQYGRVSALESAKLIWDRLSKVNEGISTQRDSRVDVLRNLFNHFKRLDNENV